MTCGTSDADRSTVAAGAQSLAARIGMSFSAAIKTQR